MKTITMLRDTRVAPNGFTVELWESGSSHDVEDQLAEDLIASGAAEDEDKPRRKRAKVEGDGDKKPSGEGDGDKKPEDEKTKG